MLQLKLAEVIFVSGQAKLLSVTLAYDVVWWPMSDVVSVGWHPILAKERVSVALLSLLGLDLLELFLLFLVKDLLSPFLEFVASLIGSLNLTLVVWRVVDL